jgi:hypothetical protein
MGVACFREWLEILWDASHSLGRIVLAIFRTPSYKHKNDYLSGNRKRPPQSLGNHIDGIRTDHYMTRTLKAKSPFGEHSSVTTPFFLNSYVKL